MNLQTDLTPAEAEALALWLNRLTFSDFVRRTDGDDGDKEQSYLIQAAVVKIREALANTENDAGECREVDGVILQDGNFSDLFGIGQ